MISLNTRFVVQSQTSTGPWKLNSCYPCIWIHCVLPRNIIENRIWKHDREVLKDTRLYLEVFLSAKFVPMLYKFVIMRLGQSNRNTSKQTEGIFGAQLHTHNRGIEKQLSHHCFAGDKEAEKIHT